MMAYTKNRKVHLLQAGGTDFAPEVVLLPMTRVELIFSPDPAPAAILQGPNGLLYAKAVVMEGAHKGREGYLSLPSLSEYAANRLRSFDMGTSGITSNTYGEDVLLWDGEENRIWQPNCVACGYEPGLHKLVESMMKDDAVWEKPVTTSATTASDSATRLQMVNAPRSAGTADDIARLYRALRAKQKKQGFGYGDSAARMIGVLHVAQSDNVYACHSGGDVNATFKAVVESLGFIYAGPVATDKPVLTRGGQPAVERIQQMASAGQLTCAAPRLIQTAIRAGEWPYAMTEIWFNPKDAHGKYPDHHTIESCDKCRGSVPLMLCPDDDA
jgi:hypothetical protein